MNVIIIYELENGYTCVEISKLWGGGTVRPPIEFLPKTCTEHVGLVCKNKSQGKLGNFHLFFRTLPLWSLSPDFFLSKAKYSPIPLKYSYLQRKKAKKVT